MSIGYFPARNGRGCSCPSDSHCTPRRKLPQSVADDRYETVRGRHSDVRDDVRNSRRTAVAEMFSVPSSSFNLSTMYSIWAVKVQERGWAINLGQRGVDDPVI